jgi:XTP/dITP diphosphohydrolase
MKLLFATSNKNKLAEIHKMLPSEIELLSLEDINLKTDIPETSSTIEGNAKQKSNYIIEHFGIDCFADDTGLEVDALNGKPGVYSARYAGEEKSDYNNRQLLLKNLKGVLIRTARFKTVISLEFKGRNYLFEGIVEGTISEEERGEKGFGYDSIFIPNEYNLTFAELDLDIKNKISHRGRAFRKMIDFLSEQVKIG